MKRIAPMREADFDTVTVTRSKTLFRPDGRAAILLEGSRPASGPYSVAFEMTLATIPLLRAELDRAEQFLSQRPGTA